ncbi:mechanosensitive ion channel domain-containing protein [Catenovulum adriaticum]|uniref:Small-conductance mechanosensitive channel n=1 Tax=Catenovulum adriaticum TaxID=2984846 RepID=A0ABY7AKC7_9ALTE|nr:mechanosensitive ion channel domain-containing protein [Catenovulum sp. TS8]WAJ69989.1 mechanosensitive ion channel [Catenovulum sp. TS8]
METVTEWFENNQGLLISYAVSLITAILILWIGFKIARKISTMINNAMVKKSIDPAVASFVASLSHAIIAAAIIIVALGHVGVQTATFVAILGAAGLAIGLSLQGSLANFASGILITVFRPFKAGDFIEAGGVAGVVKEIQIFSTIMTTPDNKFVVVPNAQVTGSPITNYSRHDTRRLDMVIGVSYSADLQQTEDLLNRIVKSHPNVLETPEPTVAVSELADSSVNFVVRPWVNTANYWPTKFELTKTIKQELDKANIGIPFPQMDIHVHKEEKTESE